jgi:hypothetical protein
MKVKAACAAEVRTRKGALSTDLVLALRFE